VEKLRKEIEFKLLEKEALATENKSFCNSYKILEREFKKFVKEYNAIKQAKNELE
jgi:hypothetical protein